MAALVPLHGGQLYQIAERFGVPASDLLDFSANINPEGPPAAVFSTLRESLDDPSVLTHYPEIGESALRSAIATHTGVNSENIAVANGFVPLLDAALRVLPIRSCLLPVPAFVEYRRTLTRADVEVIPQVLTPESGFLYDVHDMVSGSHDAILFANPQNPSGVLCDLDVLLELVARTAEKNVYILLDEAFIDYCPEESLTREIDRFPNLIVFRSVTKFFGMAGLRVAYAVASTELSRRFQEAIAPWSVTTLASIAAGVAVRDEAYAKRAIALNRERRNQLQTTIEKLDVHVYPSAANFLLLRLPASIDGQELWERLIREHHIVLRNCVNYESLPDRHLRSAVRTHAENERLIDALAREVEKA
jgi:threonine-phosphate decarboxylase